MKTTDPKKHVEAVKELSLKIFKLRYDLMGVDFLVKEDGYFLRLEKSINDAENILKQMREAFKELKELEPDNR